MADRGFNPQNQLTNMGRPPNAIPRVDRSGKVRALRIGGAAWAKYPDLRERDRCQGYRLQTTPSGAERAQIRVILGQKFPAPPFVRFDAGHFQNERGKIFYLTGGMLNKNLQAGDILA
jgi:hypothetical protein